MNLLNVLNENLYINNLLSPKNADIEFVDFVGCYAAFPELSIKLAKNVTPITKKYQEENLKSYNFPKCPGMWDYSRMGYVIPAWDFVKIKANSAGVSCFSKTNHDTKLMQKSPEFEPGIFDGLFIPDGIPKQPRAFNLACPWRVRTKPGISLLVLPAFYHCNLLDDLYMFSGVVDYDRGFSTINCIVSAKRKCEVTIKPGDPLLQVIPICNDKHFTAEYGYGKNFPTIPVGGNPFTAVNNFYRKYFLKKKKYSLKFIDDKK